MKRLKYMKVINNKKGAGNINTVIIIFIIMILLAVVLIYANTMTIATRIKEDSETVLQSFTMKKAIEIYEAVKNGNNVIISEEFTDEYNEMLKSKLGLTDEGYLVAHDSSKIIMKSTSPITGTIDNLDLLKLKASYIITIPLYFNFTIDINMTIYSLYNIKNY